MGEKEPLAFPLVGDDEQQKCFDTGMTLRDYFAGQVIDGLLCIVNPIKPEPEAYAKFATMAYGVADAMLTEREKS